MARTHAGLCAALLVGWSTAAARELDAGVPDLTLRFDNTNTVRYNVGLRTDPIDARIGANPAFTAGEYRVSQGGVTTNRIDLLSELDAGWRERYGARLSAAAWYDAAYGDTTTPRSPQLSATPGTYVGNRFSRYTRDRYRGPWGEILDGFAFARVDAGGVPLTLKAGRHTVYWGESLMLAGNTHGIAYAQMPLDLQKGYATPGVEAKELFRPLASVSAQAQVTPSLSLAALLFLEWQPYVYPEGATFLGAGDFAFQGPDGTFRPLNGAPSFIKNGGESRARDFGEWGVAARWRPDPIDATLGLYYRRYSDKFAAVLVTPNPGGQGPLSPSIPSPLQYRQYYGEDVDLLGLSVSRQVLGASVGLETSYRRDTPLVAQTLGFAAAPSPATAALLFPSGAPTLRGNTYQARGDTLHALVNAVGVVSAGRVADATSWAVEVTYSRWLEVRSNRDMFYGEGFGVCRSDPALAAAGLAKDRGDGCATRDHVALGAALTPTWYRVWSGVDLLLPLNASWTVHGNSPVTTGGNEGSGTFGLGVAADVRSRYRLDLRYVDFFGRVRGNGTMVTSANGQLALLRNRGNVTLTAKATF